MEKHVSLQRQFYPLSKNEKSSESNEFISFLGHYRSKSWNDLEQEYRSVILASGGTGKTEELRYRAKLLLDQGKFSFFIRIEDIGSSFWQAFEIGEEMQFQDWLKSTEDAWFFLDSIDEARLDNPRTFEKALRIFSRTINQGKHRAHIYLSSRPYAWRFSEDRYLLDEILFFPKSNENINEDKKQSSPESALIEYTLLPLDFERIRRFIENRGANDINRLLSEIERYDLGSLAERPFDLESILAKWAEDNALGSRSELLLHNIERRLRDTHNMNRAQRQPLNLEQAKEGARRLAAAVVLSGQASLNVPDPSIKLGIESEDILADWKPTDVRSLLERGIFNDIIYGAVRFRHREVRDFLAAEWFDSLLKSGNSRSAIESLFFREQYGERIITPRLRPVLSWLILLDEGIRRKALQILPEIAVEAGDPSKLPLCERQKILNDIVYRIVTNQDDRSARDNNAIARIANSDLATDVLRLIHEYYNNDEAIFFLGRLVWQGAMTNCLGLLMTISLDSSRGKYARVACTRAVIICGDVELKQTLWQKFNDANDLILRELLIEIVHGVEPNSFSVEQLLISIRKLEPYDQFKPTGLEDALREFVAKLSTYGSHNAINKLIEGLHKFLVIPPFVEHGHSKVSKTHTWILSIAINAIEKLVENRNIVALEAVALSTMLMVPALSIWGHGDFNEYKSNLQTLIPEWPELNDALYWASIEEARCLNTKELNATLTDESSVLWLGHFWQFDTTSFHRLIHYIQSRRLQNDRLIAVNTAYRVYIQDDKPENMLDRLKFVTANEDILRDRLSTLLNPPVSEYMKQMETQLVSNRYANEMLKAERKKDYDQWIDALREKPERISRPENIKLGEMTKDQCYLLMELRGEGLMISRQEAKDWRALITSFGQAVAYAYREAAINHWRHYLPTLLSEGVIKDDSVPYSLIFAMAGIEIEAAETSNFPHQLSDIEASHALRYLTWELNNRFPSWFERMYKAFPKMTVDAVMQELIWELENTTDQSLHYILHRVIYGAPWLFSLIAPQILNWISINPGKINTNQHYCLQILAKGGIQPNELAKLANRERLNTNQLESIARWYAITVDCDPDNGIPALERWLSSLLNEERSYAAQVFITALMGGTRDINCGSYFGNFHTAEHLKTLYVLMHQYIETKEDIDRTNGGVYSPLLRDDAQDARNILFNLITEIPGKSSYIVIKQLIEEHPNLDYRPRMAKLAYQRAETDGNLEAWTAKQVFDFSQSQTFTPTTHRQLFDLTVLRLIDLKNWLERGNDSTWKTWRRVEEETEMRTLIASELRKLGLTKYVTAQEPELANGQRMDIWLHNTNVQSPVPIELKLLDKKWTGPKLCERLRNQLAGDYLREKSSGCGVFLLVAQNITSTKRWKINDKNVLLADLADALKKYWDGISGQYPGILAIEVMVIDLTQRERVSNS